ncbi:hypothetical protein RhiJN_11739 [Ceratobasidium sp. AG-Ba]|nr:hypothetical protein RhiJN_11739 [Ceratobasidium sp. AG-Ba]
MFDRPGWRECYTRFLASYLFIVSCGGNFSPARSFQLPHALTAWMTETRIFRHVLALMHPRLIASQLNGFFGSLLNELFVHHSSMQDALLHSYCRDDLVRAHTDIVWMTGGQEALVLKNASGPRVRGLELNLPCAAGCREMYKRVKRGGIFDPDHPVILTRSCCLKRYRLRAAPGVAIPQEHSLAGFTCVLDSWPGGFAHTLEEVTEPPPAADKES